MLGHGSNVPIAILRANMRRLMADRCKLNSTPAGPGIWEGPCLLQTMSEQIQTSTLYGISTVLGYEAFLPVAAPLTGWSRLEITATSQPDLLGRSLLLQFIPVDTFAAYRRFVVRTVAAEGG